MLWYESCHTDPVESLMEAVHQEGEEIVAVLLCGPRKVRIMLPHHILGRIKRHQIQQTSNTCAALSKYVLYRNKMGWFVYGHAFSPNLPGNYFVKQLCIVDWRGYLKSLRSVGVTCARTGGIERINLDWKWVDYFS